MVRRSTDPDLTDFDKKVLPTLEEWGWYVISVGAQPPFSYSIGLFEHFQHPEIILFGLNSKRRHGIVNDAYKAGPERVEQYNGVPPEARVRAYLASIVHGFNAKKIAKWQAPRPTTEPETSGTVDRAER